MDAFLHDSSWKVTMSIFFAHMSLRGLYWRAISKFKNHQYVSVCVCQYCVLGKILQDWCTVWVFWIIYCLKCFSPQFLHRTPKVKIVRNTSLFCIGHCTFTIEFSLKYIILETMPELYSSKINAAKKVYSNRDWTVGSILYCIRVCAHQAVASAAAATQASGSIGMHCDTSKSTPLHSQVSTQVSSGTFEVATAADAAAQCVHSFISRPMPIQLECTHQVYTVWVNPGSPKIDHSCIDARIILEQNKFNNTATFDRDWTLIPRTVCDAYFLSRAWVTVLIPIARKTETWMIHVQLCSIDFWT